MRVFFGWRCVEEAAAPCLHGRNLLFVAQQEHLLKPFAQGKGFKLLANRDMWIALSNEFSQRRGPGGDLYIQGATEFFRVSRVTDVPLSG